MKKDIYKVEKLDAGQKKELKKFALQIRINTMEQFKALGFGHVGGALSVADLIAVLYGKTMKYRIEDPKWELRDKLVCSKGHAGPAIYSALALKGFFPLSELKKLNAAGTFLPSHCDMNKTPGIDMTTGSLGQGISCALGMALGDRLQKRDTTVYLILGDGELNEGQVWEGAQFASHYRMENLIAFCDWNKRQLDGYLEDVLDPLEIRKKFESFGWYVLCVDGHDVSEIHEAVTKAKSVKGKPHMIILDTVKGFGYKPFEEKEFNHHMVVCPKTADKAIESLKRQLEDFERGNGS